MTDNKLIISAHFRASVYPISLLSACMLCTYICMYIYIYIYRYVTSVCLDLCLHICKIMCLSSTYCEAWNYKCG